MSEERKEYDVSNFKNGDILDGLGLPDGGAVIVGNNGVDRIVVVKESEGSLWAHVTGHDNGGVRTFKYNLQYVSAVILPREGMPALLDPPTKLITEH